MQVPIEKTFHEFIESVGGELVEKICPPVSGEKRADYLFRKPEIIGELKSLEHDLFTREYFAKLREKSHDWMRRHLIPFVIGRPGYVLKLRNLPKECQDEWLEILEASLNRNILTRANRQIRDTKAALNMPNATGVLFLANENNQSGGPSDILSLLSRILNRTKPTGEPVCKSIQWIVLFSLRMGIASPEYPSGLALWLPSNREKDPDPCVRGFLTEQLAASWLNHYGKEMGVVPTPRKITKEELEVMQFTRKPPNP